MVPLIPESMLMESPATAVGSHPPDGWDRYLEGHPEASLYHDRRWAKVIGESFGHQTFFLALETQASLQAVLPLVFLKSPMFGKCLVSMPYFNYGGLLANDASGAQQLIAASLRLMREVRADYIELRQRSPVPGAWPTKSHKVIMLLPLPPDPDALWASFKTKLRTRVRRAEKEGFSVHFGKQDLLTDFYAVFTENMRDLGTPVYPKRFFQTICETFPDQSHIVTVRDGSRCVAAGFLLSHRTKIEVPWASSLRRYNHRSPNMLLYWNMLKYSVNNRFQTFDFGRSSRGSGTFAFKEQWGASPQETFWVYPGKDSDELPDHSPQNPKYRWATRVWTKLPLFVANRCGPWIVKNIP